MTRAEAKLLLARHSGRNPHVEPYQGRLRPENFHEVMGRSGRHLRAYGRITEVDVRQSRLVDRVHADGGRA